MLSKLNRAIMAGLFPDDSISLPAEKGERSFLRTERADCFGSERAPRKVNFNRGGNKEKVALGSPQEMSYFNIFWCRWGFYAEL